MSIITNRIGIRLEEYYPVADETALASYVPMTGAYALIRVDGKLLMGYNRWRGQWEFPAGKIEPGESPREAAARELCEETHQIAPALTLRGVFRIFDPRRGETRYRALFAGELEKLAPFLADGRDEMEKLLLWDGREDLGSLDEVDVKMAELCGLLP